AASTDFTPELLGVALGPRDLQGAALSESERLAGLLRERGELRHRALGELRELRRRAYLARQPGGARRRLRREARALEHDHAHATPGQVIRDAGAERAGSDDDDVRRGDHRGLVARSARSVDDTITTRIALRTVLVRDDALRRGVGAQEAKHPVAS